MLLTENKPYIIKKSQKQGWRVWVNDNQQHYGKKVKHDYRKFWSLEPKSKYRCVQGFFESAYEAESWYNDLMFRKTKDTIYLMDR